MTYKEIANMPVNQFADYMVNLLNININKELNISSIEGATYYGSKLMDISNQYTKLSGILAYIRICKRMVSRTEPKSVYQDYIDKEQVTEDCLKALDLQYKAINRNLCIRDTNSKELFMTGAMT